jgi:hypothetical protein
MATRSAVLAKRARTGRPAAGSPDRPAAWTRWWRAPLWLVALVTGAKSFADNPILGSPALNRAGLHVWRLKSAHALTRLRRARLAHLVPSGLREEFDRDGFVVVPNVLPPAQFRKLQQALLETELECRAQQQGDTITRRVPVGPELLKRFPALARLLDDRRWRGLMAYVASARTRPLYYIQTIAGGVAEGPPDPQVQLHSDTFHPSLKAWLFLTDVEDDDRPLTFVAGSHRLSPERVEWERKKSIAVMESDDRLSQRGSLRIDPDELGGLGLPSPTRFSVAANTLVVADTCGFHARASSDHPTVRVELWAYCRRNPFLPWTAGGLLSLVFIRERRAEWLLELFDWLDARGLRKQHWMRVGLKRPIDA